MARASVRLIVALRETALSLEGEATIYRWSRFAHCNCGHLAQTITGLAPSTIEAAAKRHPGDWGEQARTLCGSRLRPTLDPGSPAIDGALEPEEIDVCNVTGQTMPQILATLFAWGLEPADVEALERLSDSAVRRRLGTNTVDFPHGERQNVIAYLRAWADLLEQKLPPSARQSDEGASYLLAAE
jgi:hypothetical protein